MMESSSAIEGIFPPLPSKRCLSLSEDGTLSYGHKTNLITLKNTTSELQVFRGLSRLNALEYGPNGQIALGFDDGNVLLLLLLSDGEYVVTSRHEGHGVRGVMCLSWGTGGELYSLDTSGTLIAYTPALSHMGQPFRPLNSTSRPHLLAAHPNKPGILALGASKLIYILQKNKILKIHKQNEMEINSLLWLDSFLASSSPKVILIWKDPLSSNHPSTVLKNPNSNNKKEVLLAWPSLDTLISSTGPTLYEWNLETKKSSILHGLHSLESNVTSLVSRVTSKGTLLFSVATDNKLIAYELLSRTHLFSLPTLSYGVFALCPSPIEGSAIAIGCGDGKLRIWNSFLGERSSSPDVSTFWRKFKMMKINAVAWHPSQEGLLALGCMEGQICTIDIGSRRPEPILYEYKHQGSVFKVFWAPINVWDSREPSSNLALYSNGDGLIVRHESGASFKVINSDFPFQKETSDISDIELKPQEDGKGNVFVFGHTDGTVSILTQDNVLASLKYHQKLVYCTSWHPLYYNEADEPSKYSNWLAVSTNESAISIWNLDTLFSQEGELNSDNNNRNIILTNPTLVLKGHDAKVIRVMWSPHDEEKLLSISYDLSAQIWNAMTGEALANFRGHSRRLLCGTWSMSDPDIVHTGADDSMVYTWRISRLKDKVPPPFKKKKKTALKWGVAPVTFDEDNSARKVGGNKGEAKLISNKVVSEKAIFPLSVKAESESCIKRDILLLDDLNNGGKVDSSCEPYLQYFAPLSDEVTTDLALDEIGEHMTSSNTESAVSLSLWTSGDMGPHIKSAMENGRLSDWLVSLAASVSHSLWMKACESFGEQLIKINCDHLKASSYFLMSRNPLKALQVLLDGKLFRSAVSLIKGRLNSDRELLKNAYESWADSTSGDGRYELACRAWIASGNRSSAAGALAKIKDNPKALETAGILYHRLGNIEKSEILAVQVGFSYLQTENWEGVAELLSWAKEFSAMKHYFSPLLAAKLQLDKSLKELPDKLWDEKGAESSSSKGFILDLQDLICATVLSSPEDYESFYTNFKNQSASSLPKIEVLQESILCTLSLHSKQRSLLHFVNAVEKSLSLGSDFATEFVHVGLPSSGNSDPPHVGLCLWGEALAWQCQWKELDSLMCYVSYVKLRYYMSHPQSCSFDLIEDISSNVMREDVVNSQKLLLDIKEGEDALEGFTIAIDDDDDDLLPDIKGLSLNDKKAVDKEEEEEKSPNRLVPHGGNSTQTMELTSDGTWKTVLASEVPPPTDPSMPAMPPPMGLTKSFKDRFLLERSQGSKTRAQKEIQKLKWEQSRTNVLTCPYPNVTEAVKDVLLLLMEVKSIKGDPDQRLTCRIKDIATWAYWKGSTKDQLFFLELT